MDSLLLRLGWIFIFLEAIFAVPTMNAIRDEARLDDGTRLKHPFLLHSLLIYVFLGGRVYGPGVNVQDTSTPDKIVTQAYEFLERNLITGIHKEYGFQYSFSMPSSYKYGPSQWLWGTSL